MISRLKHFKVFFSDKDRKNWLIIIKEIIQFSLYKKVLPTDYIRKFLYRKDITDIKSYLSFKEFNSILLSKKLVFPIVTTLLENKLIFSIMCEQYKLPAPKLLGYNYKNSFFLNKKNSLVSNKKELASFFQKLFTVTKTDTIFLKPIDGIAGKGCILLKQETINNQIDECAHALFNNSYIYQEYINQHHKINSIYSSSINTTRIITYTNDLNVIQVISSLMRFGTGETITDNTGTGGFYISVNHNTGTLEGVARQDIVKGGKTFTRHPNTNTELEGFIVPHYKESCELAKSASAFFPNRIIGWDIAISESGPTIVEGNHNPSLHMSDVAYGGYCKHPLIKEILMEIDN
ncbi:sugar-transfer associated ATP-grasp domain-containing protein [Flavivirga rizhaonensis]|uniref:Alpha-L-glutamate ligase-related protein ATP-grasp domain-containing protein n=1 Tax=Flavivirga rizhaonensis TaxID=2559571 RepID=A0A4S1E1Z5_9FLAO|nr:sugar-transfer associated ATP-grasp domain-containing protein [Flavivirga rizhaonensis]TGV03932.1 hypothetical protein EM932_03830 [Flavivirga rizhaonensis]